LRKGSLWCCAQLGSARPQQLGQLGDVGGDAPGLVAGEQLRSRAAARLFVEIDLSERLTVLVPDGETASCSSIDQGGGKRHGDGMEES